MDSASWKKIAGALLLIYCAGAVALIFVHHEGLQWDFKAYYHTARAFSEGLNPYDTAVMARVGNLAVPRGFKLLYPPHVLALTLPLSLLSYQSALYLFLSLKCALLAGLLLIWAKGILRDEATLLFWLFCAFAFGSPLYVDLLAGNVEIINQFFLWTAFCFFLKKRDSLFCLFILLAAALKVTPLLFLGLLLFREGRRKYRYIAGSLLVFGLVILVSYLAAPEYFAAFLRNAAETTDKNVVIHQPSTFAFIRDLLLLGGAGAGEGVTRNACTGAFAAAAALVIIVTGRACARLRASGAGDRDRAFLFLFCVAYAMVLPHFEDYSFAIVLVPAYYILKKFSSRDTPLLIIIVMLLSSLAPPLPLFRYLRILLPAYAPLLMTYLCWLLYLRTIWGQNLT